VESVSGAAAPGDDRACTITTKSRVGKVSASWQARAASAAVRLVIRRRSWGRDVPAMTRRARRLLGVLRPFRGLWSRGVHVQPVRDGSIEGEWIVPDGAGDGTLLYLHGGGFVACSAATHRPITAGLARRTRWRVFGLNYRLAPEHRFPAALDDAVAGYRWLLDRGVAPGALALAGDSAGAGLALALLLRVRNAGLPLPACVVCFSPWADLSGSGDSVRTNDGRCAMFRSENITLAARAYLGDESPMNPYASPVFADLSRLPPLLLQVGSTELLLDDARRVHARVKAAGGRSRLDVFDDVPHVWQIMDGIVPEAGIALGQAAEFIRDPRRALETA
jgi:acetyl esterase/lipase